MKRIKDIENSIAFIEYSLRSAEEELKRIKRTLGEITEERFKEPDDWRPME